MNTVDRAQLAGQMRQELDATVEDRINRLVEIDHQRIIGGHHFAAASSEVILTYRDGHFISTVMASQAVNEGILRFVAERNDVPLHEATPQSLLGRIARGFWRFETQRRARPLVEVLEDLLCADILTPACGAAAHRIIRRFRNDVHHMNPTVANVPFPELARRNVMDLCAIEREVFGADFSEGRLVPRQPKYWDIQEDSTVPVFLRIEP